MTDSEGKKRSRKVCLQKLWGGRLEGKAVAWGGGSDGDWKQFS